MGKIQDGVGDPDIRSPVAYAKGIIKRHVRDLSKPAPNPDAGKMVGSPGRTPKEMEEDEAQYQAEQEKRRPRAYRERVLENMRVAHVDWDDIEPEVQEERLKRRMGEHYVPPADLPF